MYLKDSLLLHTVVCLITDNVSKVNITILLNGPKRKNGINKSIFNNAHPIINRPRDESLRNRLCLKGLLKIRYVRQDLASTVEMIRQYARRLQEGSRLHKINPAASGLIL